MQIGILDQSTPSLDLICVDNKVLAKFGKNQCSRIENFLYGFCGYSPDNITYITANDDVPITMNTLEPKDFNGGDPEAWLEEGEGREWLDENDVEEDLTDMDGYKIEVGDTVAWHDEAGYNDDGSMIEFEVVENRGDGYYNLRIKSTNEPFPDRWAWHNELEVL